MDNKGFKEVDKDSLKLEKVPSVPGKIRSVITVLETCPQRVFAKEFAKTLFCS